MTTSTTQQEHSAAVCFGCPPDDACGISQQQEPAWRIDFGMLGWPRHARITGPMAYVAPDGGQTLFPIGPCLVDVLMMTHAEIIWGENGEHQETMASDALQMAYASGYLVLLD